MKINYIPIVLVLSILLNCGSSKSKATPAQIETLHKLVEDRSFTIESEWALPFVTNGMIAAQNVGLTAPGNSANRIHLLDQPNLLTLNNNVVKAELPYYGEVQMPSGYMGSEDNSIVFDGNIEDYEVEQNEDQSYTLQFYTKSYSENFKVLIQLFPNLTAKMTLRGANRFPIEYLGIVKPQ